MSRLINALLAAFLFAAIPFAEAQLIAARTAPCEKVAAGLTYDVVSIHPAKPSEDMNHQSDYRSIGDDGYHATYVQLSHVLQDAYDLPEDQIAISGPVADVRFDIDAKVVGPDPAKPVKLSDHQLECMIAPMLADRFHLVTHTETRIRPIYELIVAKGGHKMTPAPDSPQNGTLNMGFDGNNWKLTARGESMTEFAASLSEARHRPVLDRTGLAGLFSFALEWTSEDDTDTDANAAPGLVTALQEQLGLRMQATKGPVETLVVDHVEMPSQN